MKSSFSYIPPLSCSAHSLALNPSMTYGHSEQDREGPCDLAPAYLSHIIYHTLCHSHHSGYSYLLTLFKHTKLISTSGALHFLFLLPEVIFPQLFLWPSSSFLSSLPLSATPQRGFPCPPCLNEQHLFFPCFLFHHSIDHFLKLAYIHTCLPLLSPVSERKHYDDFVDHWWIPST